MRTAALSALAEALDVPLLAQRLVADSGARALAARDAGECARATRCSAPHGALEAAASAAAAGDATAAEAVDETPRAVCDAHAELRTSLLEAHTLAGASEPHPLARPLFTHGGC